MLYFICLYDDGCNLKKYAQNETRRSATPTSQRIVDMAIIIDKMHFKGHIDPWCKEHCNPYNFKELEGVGASSIMHTYLILCILTLLQVDTEICEQTFSWLSRYSRMTRHMNKSHFLFYILYICDLHDMQHNTKKNYFFSEHIIIILYYSAQKRNKIICACVYNHSMRIKKYFLMENCQNLRGISYCTY